jgi:glutamate dehydrogenase/leucine dehydrogenase
MSVSTQIYTDPDAYRRWQMTRVLAILEREYGLSHNDAEKRLKLFFAPGFLPAYFFYAHSLEDIASHIIVLTQFMDANTERLAIESDGGAGITYFCNLGTDIPGKLLEIVRENADIEILAMDSIKTASGYRIVTIDHGVSESMYDSTVQALTDAVKKQVRATGSPHAERFLQALPPVYFVEEIQGFTSPPRILRHLELYTLARENPGVHVQTSDAVHEYCGRWCDLRERVRLSICKADPEADFIVKLLSIFQDHDVSISRTYYDLVVDPVDGSRVALASFYLGLEEVDEIVSGIAELNGQEPDEDHRVEALEATIRSAILDLSKPGSIAKSAMRRLAELCAENERVESGNFFINALTEFYEAARITGLASQPAAMRLLLRFEHISEFLVESKIHGQRINKRGYRMRHSSARGPGKGGLRLHPLAVFSEVAALSFMMTWKCARARIRLGGGKGGVLLHPNEFANPLEFQDSIAAFGKSLFLETGPFIDVPAGDVNCGADEIGMIFRGYKAALRDLVTLAFASKFGATRLGKRIVTISQARHILFEHFDVDPFDEQVIFWLTTSEHYLSLVLASQITGKPEMGIEARNGATGYGIVMCIFAAVGRLYFDGKWTPALPLDEADEAALRQAAEVRMRDLGEAPLLPADTWKRLTKTTYPRLLRDKTIVLQGTGKVGVGVLLQLRKYGVRVRAVADVQGAVLGDLDVEEILEHARERRTAFGIERGVESRISGAAEGAAVLREPCDILLPCALENAITADNAKQIQARLVVCGANGPVTPIASKTLVARGIPIVYDFLANSGGVIASYFEWLRGLTERKRFEATTIRSRNFDVGCMRPYLVPELAERILAILAKPESKTATRAWQSLIRDLLFSSFNADYELAAREGCALSTAGMIDAQLRVFAAILHGRQEGDTLPGKLSPHTTGMLAEYRTHPELGD